MNRRRHTRPERRSSLEDVGTATVFLVSFMLIVGVGFILFTGLAVTTAAIDDISQLGQSALGPRRPAVALELPAPDIADASEAAPGQLTIGGQADPTRTPTVQATPTSTPSPTPQAERYRVANTGGVGVYLRRTPNLSDRIVAWPDRTVMEVVGDDVEADGLKWKHVRDPRGNVGYIPVRWLEPLP